MRVAICDDNYTHLNQTHKTVKLLLSQKLSDSDLFIKRYMQPALLLSDHERIYYDVAFLDIDMPEIDGLTVGDLMVKVNPDCLIIYVSSHSKYAKKSIIHHVFRFVDKGNMDDFNEAIDTLVKNYCTLHRLVDFLPDNQIQDLSKILYFTAGHTFAESHYIDGKIHKTKFTLSQIEAELAENWCCRVNRSTIVNLYHVYNVDWSVDELTMTDQACITVTKKYLSGFKDMLYNFIGRNI